MKDGLRRKRVFYLWTIVDGNGALAVDGADGKTPYLWGDMAEARGNADVLPGIGADRVQRVKVTVEAVGIARRVYKDMP